MKSFKGKLPDIKYRVTVKTGKSIRKFLESYGCKLDITCETIPNMITIYCGSIYNYDLGGTGVDCVTVTPKEFKRIVREALGESK